VSIRRPPAVTTRPLGARSIIGISDRGALRLIIWIIRDLSSRAIPETGACKWSGGHSCSKGEPGIETWPDEYVLGARQRGRRVIPGRTNPELNL